jgi:hypothetical protein
MGRFKDLIEPMTLGNMRANGVRALDVNELALDGGSLTMREYRYE